MTVFEFLTTSTRTRVISSNLLSFRSTGSHAVYRALLWYCGFAFPRFHKLCRSINFHFIGLNLGNEFQNFFLYSSLHFFVQPQSLSFVFHQRVALAICPE